MIEGKKLKYRFGPKTESWPDKAWTVVTTSREKAIRAFRIAALFPHSYSTGRVETRYGPDHDDVQYLSSTPGAVVPIQVQTKDGWIDLEPILPEGTDDEFGAIDPQIRALSALEVEAATTSALAPAGAVTGLVGATRHILEEKTFEIQQKLCELEALRAEAELQLAELRREVGRRADQIWLIELFIGSHEEVKVLRTGVPAPAETPIAVRQRILCMDEEIAVTDWLKNPERIGLFDYQSLDDFDAWLLEDPTNLNTILPHEKGIVGLRVRRHRKERDMSTIANVFTALQEEEWDSMTYLLIRNGECLYRLWVDVQMWPRFFAAESDIRVEADEWQHDRDERTRKNKMFFAGVLVLQGLLERSTLFAPLPVSKLSLVDEEHQRYFNFIRDDENRKALADPDNVFAHLDWSSYRNWLRKQLGPGVRVLYTGPRYFSDSDKIYHRTGLRTVGSPPGYNELYTISNVLKGGWWPPYQFLYLPSESSWYGNGPRKRRVTWRSYEDELVPFDMMSWRVLEHLLRDRNSRTQYESYFKTVFHWWKLRKEEAEREKPFIDLVMSRAGVDPSQEDERARCERLVRWWKIKTKEHRALSDDEPKAFRMILIAFLRGDDHDNDPETLLFKERT